MANEQADKKMDIELENPADFTSPEELYQGLIRSIRKYHPSDDISMIEYAGLGVAMANASEEVRKRANYVAPHCDEDGLVDVIRRFMTD